jgi:hypothetical protein
VLDAFRGRYPFADSLWFTSRPVSKDAEQRIYRLQPSQALFVDHQLGDVSAEIPLELLRPG